MVVGFMCSTQLGLSIFVSVLRLPTSHILSLGNKIISVDHFEFADITPTR